jgi:hypothetical protein
VRWSFEEEGSKLFRARGEGLDPETAREFNDAEGQTRIVILNPVPLPSIFSEGGCCDFFGLYEWRDRAVECIGNRAQ